METIVASVCGPGRCRPGPNDGVCACALAFSTLLSSQGADAHHPRPLSLIWGNPANLPAEPGLVNRVRKTYLAWSRVVHRAYPHLGIPVPRNARLREGGGPLETPACRQVMSTGARRKTRQQRGSSQIACRTVRACPARGARYTGPHRAMAGQGVAIAASSAPRPPAGRPQAAVAADMIAPGTGYRGRFVTESDTRKRPARQWAPTPKPNSPRPASMPRPAVRAVHGAAGGMRPAGAAARVSRARPRPRRPCACRA
jgi:hypothetical protein